MQSYEPTRTGDNPDYVLVRTSEAFNASPDAASDVLWTAFDLDGYNPFELTGLGQTDPLFEEFGIDHPGNRQRLDGEVTEPEQDSYGMIGHELQEDFNDFDNKLEGSVDEFEVFMLEDDDYAFMSEDQSSYEQLSDSESSQDHITDTESVFDGVIQRADGAFLAQTVLESLVPDQFDWDYKRLADDLVSGLSAQYISQLGSIAGSAA